MAKKYTGSLRLDWFNKQKSILVQAEESGAANGDVPASKINWINKEEALFYEVVDDEGRGLSPYWVDRSDLRVKEARPLIFQKAFKAVEKPKAGSLIDIEYKLVESKEDDSAIENMLIRGDNLLALNALKKLFENRPDEEKVKCIFIDPPYNTGSAFEQYDDNLAHSEWLTLMRDRLLVLWSLISQGGSIWISIDDDESHYLKVLCDEVFGRSQFVVNIVWQKRTSRENRAAIGSAHDHILLYVKGGAIEWKNNRNLLPPNDSGYSNPDNDPRGLWRSIPFSAQGFRKNQMYRVETPSGIWVDPPKGRCWGATEPEYFKLKLSNRLYFPNNGTGRPRIKQFKGEEKGLVPMTWWEARLAGDNEEAKKEILNLFPDDEPFGTPKPERLLQQVVQIATNEGDLVLDCFGGSGTTFAVAQKMNRRWIGVEIGNHADTHIIPRLKNVLTGDDQSGISKAVNWQGGGSFKYYTLGESIIDHATRDCNWKLGREFIENSLLSSYDFAPDPEFSLPQAELVVASRQPAIGFHRVGQRQMAGIVTLLEPNEDRPISYDEIMKWYESLRGFKGTQSITVFTNRGVEIAYDSKPEDLEVIKVPHAIFAELEK